MTRWGLIAGSGAAALIGGCGGAASPPSAATSTSSSMSMSMTGSSTMSEMSANTSCAPSGTTLQISARDTKYSTDCLAAPAAQAFTIHFDNMDALTHNVSIYAADVMTNRNATAYFRVDPVMGPRAVDYAVPALSAGTYHYHCDVHPTVMDGTLVVK